MLVVVHVDTLSLLVGLAVGAGVPVLFLMLRLVIELLFPPKPGTRGW